MEATLSALAFRHYSGATRFLREKFPSREDVDIHDSRMLRHRMTFKVSLPKGDQLSLHIFHPLSSRFMSTNQYKIYKGFIRFRKYSNEKLYSKL